MPTEANEFVKHDLIKPGTLQPREYQLNILRTSLKENTLCVLPTGLGKTNIAVLLAAHRLQGFPESRVLVLAPTRPLVSQHHSSFMRFIGLEDVELKTVTGTMKPADRALAYRDPIIRIFFSTPQTARNDLESGILSLREFSLLVIDETHHSVGLYAYPSVVRAYLEQARDQRILGLTASPGADLSKIKEVMENTGLEAVEIRTEEEEDVSPYVKDKETRYVNVVLPERFERVRSYILDIYEKRLGTLRKLGYLRGPRVSKKRLLALQSQMHGSIRQGSTKARIGMFNVGQAIKLDHALMLLETQGIGSLEAYWKKVRSGQTKSDKALSGNKTVMNAMHLTFSLWEEGARHPKVGSLLTEVSRQLSQKPDSRIIVFANYRESVKEIVASLANVTGARPVEFVGQREGMTQAEQGQVLKDFSAGSFNVLVCTSIGEEGLDIPAMDLAIFYEPVPSGIRTIQRRGRVGRQMAGKVVYLITKGTRDEAYHWSALHKERKMSKTLKGMRSGPGDFR